ncbi:hypothetical protein A2397_00785 [Candidatus Amesbacteria bacterium RIFOXYB1_FULL_44_23]|uniref:DOD-type homing endonuclease domain-containing protein n=1 Tax=Candidatus Amesbacteria bacterium RIFOXYB1_FULL_44_23 TaxID=1797263 RepID=A0A1F4ZS54_9BACT|nr:MAG: hypothetical protein A2397_00785 [Candidatus Amesbacteria bacterium RIFOXYB1_FULL_44_23]
MARPERVTASLTVMSLIFKPAHIGEVLISGFIRARIILLKKQDNTEGSTVFTFKTSDDYYILGLWLADGYWRTSSIGLTSVTDDLIERFKEFLINNFPERTIKHGKYCVYINMRALVRIFMKFKSGDLVIPKKFIPAYFAGRIDGDGHVDRKHRSGIRIAYGDEFDARRDESLLLAYQENSVSVYRYKTARTWVIYLRKNFLQAILPKLSLYSWKLLPRRD